MANGNEPIKLIDLSVAGADDRALKDDISRHTVRAPKAGYWYRALKFAGETTPDPNRFAAGTFPSSLSAGKVMFIISHDGVLYKKGIEQLVSVDVFPADPLKAGWERHD